MNKNEYYRFDSNLNAKIAIDKENAKKGDVDAMVRLARYFRTGETIAFDYQDEEDALGHWYEVEGDEGVTIIERDYLTEYYPDENNFCEGLKYAQLAANSGRADGLYEYSCYLIGKAYREFDFEEYYDIVSGASIPDMEYDEDEGDRNLTEDEMTTLANELVREITMPIFDIISIAFEKMLNSAENGYGPAKFMIGCYYYSGKRFDVSDFIVDDCYYHELPECFCCGLKATNSSEDFEYAKKWFDLIINSEHTEKNEYLGRAYIMMAKICANDNCKDKNISKALEYYLKAKDAGAYINSDEIVDFYIDNSLEIELCQIFDLVEMSENDFSQISEKVAADILANHIASIFENVDETGSDDKQNFKKFPYISLDNTKLVSKLLTGNALVNFLTTRITEKPRNLGVIMNYADENGISFVSIEEESRAETDLNSGIEKQRRFLDEIDLCASKINLENSVFAYLKLLELANSGSEFAQIRLAETLWLETSTGIYLESTERTVDEAERKKIAKKLLEALATNGNDKAQYSLGNLLYWESSFDSDMAESYKQEARQWLELSASNGNVDALVVLSRLDTSKLKDAYLALKTVGRIDADINDALGMHCLENGDCASAVQYFKEGLYEETVYSPRYIDEEGYSHASYFSHLFDMLLRAYEESDCTLAKAFVSNFLNEAIDKKFKCNCKNFIHNDFVPMLLDKESLYYDPAYAIRALQSSEFSTPEGYYKLGCIYSDGEHVEKNYKQALKYFKLAAKEDVGEAYYKLGYLYYYGDGGLNPEPLRAKEYFEKAIFCGINCEYAYEMVRADLNEKDDENPMKEYADLVISETPRGAERNARFQDDMANEFGEYWEKLNENTRGFIYSGIKTYVNNYEDDDPIFDFSAAINPMAKSLETLLGDIFYTKYKQWLRVNGVSNIKEYFESLGARVSSDKDPFELGVFRFIAYERNAVNTDYETTRKLIRANKLPAIIRKSGKVIYKLQLHEKFAEYANEIFKEDAFSSDERMQEITAFIINLVSQVEVIREDLRNRASHDTVMKAMHAEKCGNILYKTKKLLYSLISKIKE